MFFGTLMHNNYSGQKQGGKLNFPTIQKNLLNSFCA